MRVAVLGVGLIGGSVALAARRGPAAEVVGWDPDPEVLAGAVADGILDGPLEQDDPADVWVAAAPVAALPEVVARACATAPAGAVVTDVGSTKAALVQAATDERFIGGHPLAGAEAAGARHARADLFDGATWYLTPVAHSSGVAYERLHRFVAGLGALPQAIPPADHDRLMAAVSHLPHLLANVLVEEATEVLGEDRPPETGPSFRDATRVAGANPPLWAQIYAANATALGEAVDRTIARLTALRGRLDDLEGWQEDVRRRRAALERTPAGDALTELRVAVPNRPGIVAELALALGGAGIDIADMSLAPSADARTGIVGLWVAEPEAARARELVAARGVSVT